MDPWGNHNHRLRNRKDHRHPSFSSTLIDQIYHSIDDNNNNSGDKTTMNRREIAGDFVRSRNPKTVQHSSSSSSDSSGFSSSESDSYYKRSRSENFHHPIKPIRTTVIEKPPQIHHHGSFLRTKSKALKIYSDLKKVKQPISPGGRLATFLNSIFTGKPNKINTVAVATSSTTTCSSASSFSRSCLSKTPSSSEKSKRSVRFLEESHNKLYGNNDNRESNRNNRVMEENRRVIEAAKELLRNYRENKDVVVKISGEEEEEEDDDDDDAASCASSDLFELDNLSAVGIGKYREELPVYETTRLNTNRIISR